MKKSLIILTALLVAVISPAQAESDCNDGKRTCKDMDSCADARFHLEQCGMTKLDRDGDGDGVPCESICGKGKKK